MGRTHAGDSTRAAAHAGEGLSLQGRKAERHMYGMGLGSYSGRRDGDRRMSVIRGAELRQNPDCKAASIGETNTMQKGYKNEIETTKVTFNKMYEEPFKNASPA